MCDFIEYGVFHFPWAIFAFLRKVGHVLGFSFRKQSLQAEGNMPL